MATLIIRPTAAGDETNLSAFPSGQNFEAVDEAVSDGETTYVLGAPSQTQRDLYNLADTSGIEGVINSVTVYASCLVTSYPPEEAYGRTAIKTNGTVYLGDEITLNSGYATASKVYTTNPNTGAAWTVAQLDALQAGVSLRDVTGGGNPHCTQVYVEIDYVAVTLATATLAGVGTLTAAATSALLNEQKKKIYTGLVRVALTKAGSTTYTYYNYDRVRYIEHTEEDDSYIVNIVLSNHDNALTSVDLTGYTATISWGTRLSVGDAYAPRAPLYVLFQTYNSRGGVLTCSLNCIGIINKLSQQGASENYLPTSSDTDTLKDMIVGLMAGVGYGYPIYDAVTLSWDSEDSVIDSFVPKNYFRVYEGAGRLSKLNEALGYSKEVKRVEDDGEIHFLNPTISGTTYDYEYKLDVVDEHTFYVKSRSTALVIPNQFIVKDGTGFQGSATDTTSWGLVPKYVIYVIPIVSDAEGDTIATAMLQRATLASARASILVPMNVRQQLWDYVKITDRRENGSTITGNVQYIRRVWNAETGQFSMEIRFGSASAGLPEARSRADLVERSSARESSAREGGNSDFSSSLRQLDGVLSIILDLLKEIDSRLDQLEGYEVDSRIDDAINSGDATTDGVIDAIRDIIINKDFGRAA